MIKIQSHGRGLFRIAAYLSIPVGIALITGISIGALSKAHSQKTVSDQLIRSETQMQLKFVKKSVQETLAQIGEQSLRVSKLAQPTLEGTSILQWARFNIADDSSPRTLEQNAKTMVGAPIGAQTVSIDANARMAIAAIKVAPFKAGATQAIISLKPYFGLVTSGIGNGEYLVAVVDPKTVFAGLQGFDSRTDTGDLRAYVIAEDGTVWGHSQESYVGSDFSSVPLYLSAIRGLLVGRGQSGSAEAHAADRLNVHAAYAKVGDSGLAAVVEKTIPESTLLGAFFASIFTRGFFSQLATGAAVAWSFLAVLMLGVAEMIRRKFFGGVVVQAPQPVRAAAPTRAERRAEKANQKLAIKNAAAQKVVAPKAEKAAEKRIDQMRRSPLDSYTVPKLSAKPAEGEVNAALSSTPIISVTDQNISAAMNTFTSPKAYEIRREFQATENVLRREIQALQVALKRVQSENMILNQFEEEALQARDPLAVAQKLSLMAANLCRGPALYFGFNEAKKIGVLQAAAGFTPTDKPLQAAIPLSDSFLAQILERSRETSVISVSDYEPLAQLVLARTGVAHFEAWAITGFGHLGRQAGRTRILGFLVILNAGSESVNQRETVNRMIRSTGLIYENTLLSR